MIALRKFARRLRDDSRGAYIVELALVFPMMIIVTLVIIDFGYRMYLGAAVEGTVHRAARRATIGTATQGQVDDYIREQLTLFKAVSSVTIEKTNYYQFSRVGKPEKIISDTAPFDQYNTGDCFEDSNGNGVYDVAAGRSGLGGSDDIVYYKVTATFPRLVPLFGFMGWSKTETVTANTVLRNQPFASQTIPTVRCS